MSQTVKQGMELQKSKIRHKILDENGIGLSKRYVVYKDLGGRCFIKRHRIPEDKDLELVRVHQCFIGLKNPIYFMKRPVSDKKEARD